MDTEIRYVLIAYKPASSDYCRGCLMASYSGDFIMEKHLTRNELINSLTSILWKNKTLECNESGYDNIEILVVNKWDDTVYNQQYVWLEPDSKEYIDILNEAKQCVSKKQADEEKKRIEEERLKAIQKLQEQVLRERKEYERLRTKFQS